MTVLELKQQEIRKSRLIEQIELLIGVDYTLRADLRAIAKTLSQESLTTVVQRLNDSQAPRDSKLVREAIYDLRDAEEAAEREEFERTTSPAEMTMDHIFP